jgi:hypothetical protein
MGKPIVVLSFIITQYVWRAIGLWLRNGFWALFPVCASMCDDVWYLSERGRSLYKFTLWYRLSNDLCAFEVSVPTQRTHTNLHIRWKTISFWMGLTNYDNEIINRIIYHVVATPFSWALLRIICQNDMLINWNVGWFSTFLGHIIMYILVVVVDAKIFSLA